MQIYYINYYIKQIGLEFQIPNLMEYYNWIRDR